MFEPYAFIRNKVAGILKSSVYAKAAPGDIHCCSKGFELNTPLPLMLGENADEWRDALQARLAAQDGSSVIKNVFSLGGHLCFSLSDAAYSECIARITTHAAPLVCLPDVTTYEEYAYMRMRMLERKKKCGFIPDESVKKALWLAFSLVETKNRNALNEACVAALSIGSNLTPIQRFALKERCGSTGHCIAALIYWRIALS